MDLLTLILACSLHPDDELVRVLIDIGSQGNVYFVGDLARLNTYDTISSLDEARRVVAQIQRDGGRPGVGLLGIPLPWADRFGRRQPDLFDGCTNIAIASSVLAAHARECRDQLQRPARKRQRRSPPVLPAEILRPCVLRRYGQDLGVANFAQAVFKTLAERRLDPAADRDPEPERSPVFIDGSDDSSSSQDPKWSNPRLFVSPY